jgi:hypothetical protein
MCTFAVNAGLGTLRQMRAVSVIGAVLERPRSFTLELLALFYDPATFADAFTAPDTELLMKPELQAFHLHRTFGTDLLQIAKGLSNLREPQISITSSAERFVSPARIFFGWAEPRLLEISGVGQL